MCYTNDIVVKSTRELIASRALDFYAEEMNKVVRRQKMFVFKDGVVSINTKTNR